MNNKAHLRWALLFILIELVGALILHVIWRVKKIGKPVVEVGPVEP